MSSPSVTNFFTDSEALLAGSSIDGGWESANTDYILISINTDTQTLIQLQHSHDSSTIDYTDTVTYTNTGTSQTYIYSRKASFIQIRLENTSGSSQSVLRCYREFIGLPETSNVFNSNLYTQIETTNSLLTNINSNIGGGGVSTYNIPLVTVSITNGGTVLRDGAGILRGYHVTSILNNHSIIGLYDSNIAPVASNTPLIRIPISKSGDVSLMLDGGGVAFSNGLSVRGSSTFDISRNIDVKPGSLAGSFYWSI